MRYPGPGGSMSCVRILPEMRRKGSGRQNEKRPTPRPPHPAPRGCTCCALLASSSHTRRAHCTPLSFVSPDCAWHTTDTQSLFGECWKRPVTLKVIRDTSYQRANKWTRPSSRVRSPQDCAEDEASPRPCPAPTPAGTHGSQQDEVPSTLSLSPPHRQVT